MALLLPLIACIVIQVFNRWRINLHRAGGANTSRARIYKKLIWLSALSILMMLALPNFFSSMGVYVPAILLVFMAFVMANFIASYQKDI